MEKSIGHIRKYVFVYMYMALYAHRISLVQNIYTSTRPTSKPDKTLKHDMVSILGDDNATDQQNRTKFPVNPKNTVFRHLTKIQNT